MTKCLLEIPLPNRLRLFPCKAKVGHAPSVALLQLHGRKIRYDGHLRRKRRGLHPKLGRQQRHFARCKESEPVRKPGRRSFRDDAPIPFRQHILPEPDCLRKLTGCSRSHGACNTYLALATYISTADRSILLYDVAHQSGCSQGSQDALFTHIM